MAFKIKPGSKKDKAMEKKNGVKPGSKADMAMEMTGKAPAKNMAKMRQAMKSGKSPMDFFGRGKK